MLLGLDLASDPRRTAACLLSWQDGGGTVLELRKPADDAQVIELAGAADLVAIDAPLGWPAPFVAAVSGHAAGEPWPPTRGRDLAWRATDQHVAAQAGWWPLSVSSDRIGVVAWRAARLLGLHRVGHRALRSRPLSAPYA